MVGFFLHSDCLLYIFGCFLWSINLSIYVSGEYIKVLVVFSTMVNITQLLPPRTLCNDNLACLGHMAELGDY